jgi:hypothetical protein
VGGWAGGLKGVIYLPIELSFFGCGCGAGVCGGGGSRAAGRRVEVLASVCHHHAPNTNRENHFPPFLFNVSTEAEGYPAVMEAASNLVMERGFDLIEQFVQPPIDQFFKCVFFSNH